MKAMVFAAGFGSRLRPLTLKTPKPLFPVMNVPVMEHLLRDLARQGIDEVMVNLHHLPSAITDYFGDGSRLGIKTHYSHEEAILGTAGGIMKVRSFLEDAPFLVINSDIVVDFKLDEMLAFHNEKQSALTLALTASEPEGPNDPIEIDADQRVVHMVGASSMNLPEVTSRVTFTGIQIIDPEIFDRIPANKFCGTTSDIYPGMIEDGKPVYAFSHTGFWNDMGTLGSYLKVHRQALDGAVPLPNAKCGHTTTGGSIIEPVCVDDECTIAPDATVGPYTVLGKGCRVESGAVVDHSVLWEGAVVEERSTVRRSVLADHSRVPAGQTVEGCMHPAK